MSKGRRVTRVGGIAVLALGTLGLPVSGDETQTRPGSEEVSDKSSFSSPNGAALFDASGYRLRAYRAPVPASAPGAQTVTLDEVQSLQSGGAILIDVMGLQRFHIDAAGEWITPSGPGAAHDTIPGAAWLPVVGWGEPEPWQEDYLRQSLADLTSGDRGRPVVVFCKTDCWLSWNAARRIAELGQEKVYWFPGGSDDWADAGLELTRARPYPLPNGAGRPPAP